ncbi:MAG: YybH family protein [Flavisolibacter sp.]
MKRTLTILLPLFILVACQQPQKPEDLQKQVADAEAAFARMAAEKGIAEAFWYFADDSATIKRQNDTLLHGRDAIRQFYSATRKDVSLTWSPDFVQVSDDGTLAYTYGRYHFSAPDSTGKANEHTGVFHTVWKRQKDGGWKYVWD